MSKRTMDSVKRVRTAQTIKRHEQADKSGLQILRELKEKE